MNATQATETLEKIIESLSHRIQCSQVETDALDADGWSIPAWDLEDREDEIASFQTKIRIQFLDDDRDIITGLISKLIATAAAAGIALVEETDSRWRAGRDHGIQVNLTVA